VDGFSYDGFERAKELVKVGEDAARTIVPQLHAWFEATETQTVTAPVKGSSGGAVSVPRPTLAPAK